MDGANRYCAYVDWAARRVSDEVLARIGTDVIPDGEASETCIYWDERRPDILVISWNLDAPDESAAHRLAGDAIRQAVGQVVPGHLGDVTSYPVDDEDE
jgi:hypothetical protein